MMYKNSVWAATSIPYKARSSLDEYIQTDTAIIGGGFTGLATAYFLRKKNIDTVILEENLVGWGASGRNGGILTPGYKTSFPSMVKRFGMEGTKELFDISIKAIDMIGDLVEKYNIDCQLENNGSFQAAYKPSHIEKLKKYQEYMYNNFDYSTTLVDKKDIGSEINSDYYAGVLIDPNGKSFHPLNFAIEFGKVVESLGTKIYEKTKAIKVKKIGNDFIVKTPSGEVKAKHLVVATNAYTDKIFKKLHKSVVPIVSHMIATEHLPDELANKLIPNRRGGSDTKNMLYFFRLSPDNRMLFGGRIRPGGKNKDLNVLYAQQKDNLTTVFPELKDFKIDFHWGGNIGMTLDLYPQIGELKDGTLFSIGYNGRGASLSIIMGQLLAEKIVDKGREKSLLESLPLKVIPFHSQHAKAVNLVALYYRLRDYVS